MFIGKIYPIPTNIIEKFDYECVRYYKTHSAYYRTHQATPYFYQDRDIGCVEKISAKEYLKFKHDLEILYENSQKDINKKVQLLLF